MTSIGKKRHLHFRLHFCRKLSVFNRKMVYEKRRQFADELAVKALKNKENPVLSIGTGFPFSGAGGGTRTHKFRA